MLPLGALHVPAPLLPPPPQHPFPPVPEGLQLRPHPRPPFPTRRLCPCPWSWAQCGAGVRKTSHSSSLCASDFAFFSGLAPQPTNPRSLVPPGGWVWEPEWPRLVEVKLLPVFWPQWREQRGFESCQAESSEAESWCVPSPVPSALGVPPWPWLHSRVQRCSPELCASSLPECRV